MVCSRYVVLGLASFASIAIASRGDGQTLTLDPVFQTPNQATAPTQPSALANGGVPLASVNQVTGFGRVFGFGSSSTDTRNSVTVLPGYGIRFSNGNAVAVELLAPVIGALNRPGSVVPLASPPPTNFALAGTTSATALPEVTQFQAAYGRFAPNDIAFLWSGINDWTLGGISPSNYRTVAANDIANQITNIREFINLGARNVVVIGQAPFSTFQAFIANLTALGIPRNNPASVQAGAVLVDQGLQASLPLIHAETGANIHFVDLTLFIDQIRADPTLYGFTAFGVRPDVNCVSLEGTTVPSCPANASFAVQNQYLSWDGIHYTNRFHTELAQAVANQLLAPYTVAPQTGIAGSGATAFGSDLFLHLDAYRSQAVGGAVASGVDGRPFSLFTEGNYLNAGQDNHPGAPQFNNDVGSLTVGGEYRVSPAVLFGAAFGYASTTVNLDSLGEIGSTRTSLDSYQLAGFASFNEPQWFIDAEFGYGFDQYSVSRAGLIDRLTSKPGGNTLFAAARGAYLFDVGSLQIGPLAGLSYDKVWIDAYTEAGDPLLTQSVRSQGVDSLQASLGIQARRSFTVAGHAVSPFVNLTAEREFLGGIDQLVTAQTYAPDLPTTTRIGIGTSTFGKMAAGASFEFGGGLSATLNGSATFARAAGDVYLLNGGLNYSF